MRYGTRYELVMSQSHYIYTTVVAINVMAFDVFVVVDDGKGTEIKS